LTDGSAAGASVVDRFADAVSSMPG